MKTTHSIFAAFLILVGFSTLSAQSSASKWATTENVRTATSVGRDIKAKKYDKAATKVLSHKEVKNRSKLSDRELALLKNPKGAATDARKDPLTFATKHKASFWDRFRKTKKSTKPTKK
jgi:hypothetical protein